jgi:adenylosuccinate synthase
LTAVHDRILVSDRVNVLLDMHMAVDGLEEKELGGSSYGFDALFKKQQLMKTSDAAIGTTRRGNVPSELHAGFLSAAFAPLQALHI